MPDRDAAVGHPADTAPVSLLTRGFGGLPPHGRDRGRAGGAGRHRGGQRPDPPHAVHGRLGVVAELLGVHRPRPFGVPVRSGWGGFALPSVQVVYLCAVTVGVPYELVPAGAALAAPVLQDGESPALGGDRFEALR